ncbi:hypothetical protein [Parabacteroides sp. 52]|nr:hypothetical protein [Parabacteroides sp. 52]
MKEIIKFFTDKEYSFSSKLVGTLIVLSALLLVDNILGFSFYYNINQKTNQIEKIERIKKEAANNLILLENLEMTEKLVLERKNIFKKFLDLFSKEPFDKIISFNDKSHSDLYAREESVVTINKSDTSVCDCKFNHPWIYSFRCDTLKVDTAYNEFENSKKSDTITIDNDDFEKEEKCQMVATRSKLWHTVTSSFLFIFALILMPFLLFDEKKKINSDFIIGLLFVVIFFGFLIWLWQYLFGLIPVIYGKPWINYIVNILINFTLVGLSVLGGKKKT